MNLLRSLLGRRQFLAAFLGSSLVMAFGRVGRAFRLFFKTDVAEASAAPATGSEKTIKGIVAYYSATGNTAQVARAIHTGMKSVIPCDVAPLKKLDPKDMAKYDVMAIGAPNWYMREPAIVKLFTHDMPRMDGKHCIIFGTHGGMPKGQFWSMSRNMLKKGMTIIGWGDWYGSDFMSPHAEVPDGEWGHPDKQDLDEAEEFGKEMALISQKIYAGDKSLIPEIPTPEEGQQSLWAPNTRNSGDIVFASPPPDSIPYFDLTKCVYPRCTQCIDNCPVKAIDLSMMAVAGSIVSQDEMVTQDELFSKPMTEKPDLPGSPLVLKEACQNCGGLCQRVCRYDAIAYLGEKIRLVVNTEKCTFPECKACIENCPQESMDFSNWPEVVVHNHCEAEGLCWGVCPENAIEVPNMAEIQLKKAWWFQASAGFTMPGGGPPGGFRGGEGEPGEGGRMMRRSLPGFRQLVSPEEIGSRGQVMFFTEYPRVPIKEELWPYEIDEE